MATTPPSSGTPIAATSTGSAGQAITPNQGGSAGTTSRARGSRASTLPIKGGKREVKAYALTEDELTTLGAIQGLAALFFSLAGISFGIWLSIKLQIAFAPEQTAGSTMGYWQGLMGATKWVAIGCAALGFVLFGFNAYRVRKIKRGTVH